MIIVTHGAPSFAHDAGYYDGFFGHVYDHLEHQRFHQQFNEEHWQGFATPEEHEDWHRAYGDTHREFHQDHPATWHDHYNYGAYGYRPYIWYQPYGYTGWYRGY